MGVLIRLALKQTHRCTAGIAAAAVLVGHLSAGDASAVDANNNSLDANLVRAVYSYKFGKFIRWPREKLTLSGNSFKFCVLGRHSFGRSALSVIQGKSLQGRPLSVELYESGLIPEDALDVCHILYISASEKKRLSSIFSSLAARPVLTISDIDDFSRNGGMITLVESNGRIRFEVNVESLRRAGLSISSKILELATVVHDSPHGEGVP